MKNRYHMVGKGLLRLMGGQANWISIVLPPWDRHRQNTLQQQFGLAEYNLGKAVVPASGHRHLLLLYIMQTHSQDVPS